MDATTHTLETSDVDLVYDVREVSSPGDAPPLLMAGHPMDARGFDTLAGFFTDRVVVSYDPRGIGRSVRKDGRTERSPELHAVDLHALVEALGLGPVDVFASSGGAVNALAFVAAYPDDVGTLVAHEPPLLAILPDADLAFRAEAEVQEAYRTNGFGAGMMQFMALTSWQGAFTDDYFAQPAGDPAQFGMPTVDDGDRDNPILSGTANGITAFRPDVAALHAAQTRVVIGGGLESRQTLPGRTAVALAGELDLPLADFPSHHGGFLAGDYGYAGQPEAFAARLRELLDGA